MNTEKKNPRSDPADVHSSFRARSTCRVNSGGRQRWTGTFDQLAAYLAKRCKTNPLKVDSIQKITPFLWFDNQAEEAVKFYTSIFKNSRIGKIARYGEAGEQVSGQPAGSVMTVEFQLEGQEFVALNGGPHFKFTEAISFVVNCKTQAEVDKFWKKLSAGGTEAQCGWLKDKYGLCWQIVPTVLSHAQNGETRHQKIEAGGEAKIRRTEEKR